MRKKTATIIFLAGLLLQGVHSANAEPKQQSFQGTYSPLSLPKKESEVRVKELKKISYGEIKGLLEANNPELAAKKSQVDQYKQLLLEAISAWYPTINLSANGLPQYLKGDQFNNNSADTSSEQWKNSISVEIKWNLIDPARIPEIASAKDSFEKSKLTYFMNLRNLNFEALTRFLLLQEADEGIRIGSDSVKASQSSLNDAKARFDAGIANKLEVLEAETQLARDRQLLSRKIGDQKIYRRSLAQILNLPETITPIADSSPEVIGLWEATLEESIISAYEIREELKRLKLDVSINNSNANSALASSQPTISIVNTYSASSTQGELLSSSPDMNKSTSSTSNTIGINASWKLFDGGKSKARYKYNKKRAYEAALNFASKKGKVREEVEESFFNLETAQQDISTTKKEIIAARESLRLALLRLEAGITTQREVVNNQRDLTEAEVRHSNAITRYNKSLLELRHRSGIDRIKSCQSIRISNKKDKIDISLGKVVKEYLSSICPQ